MSCTGISIRLIASEALALLRNEARFLKKRNKNIVYYDCEEPFFRLPQEIHTPAIQEFQVAISMQPEDLNKKIHLFSKEKLEPLVKLSIKKIKEGIFRRHFRKRYSNHELLFKTLHTPASVVYNSLSFWSEKDGLTINIVMANNILKNELTIILNFKYAFKWIPANN